MLAALTVAADAGAPCPTNAELASAIDRTPDWASDVLAILEAQGVVVVTRRGNNFRRVRIVATGAETDWSTILSDGPRAQAVERLFAAIAAAAEAGAPAPSNAALATAAGWTDENSTGRAIHSLVHEGRITVERVGKNRRRFTIVATGAVTGWNELAPFGRRSVDDPEQETAPCASTDGPWSPDVALTPSDPAPTTPSIDDAGPDPSPAASSDSPPSPADVAAPSSPPAGASEPVSAAPASASKSSASTASPGAPRGSPGPAVAAPSAPAVRLAAGPVPTASKARREPQPPPPPKARPALRPDEQAQIEAAVQAGKVTVVPTGATGLVQKNPKGEPIAVVPPPFPDAPAWAREAAVYLQKRNVQVVTNGTGKWLLDGRWSVTDIELVERANKKRAHQKLPPIELPADAVAKKRGRAA